MSRPLQPGVSVELTVQRDAGENVNRYSSKRAYAPPQFIEQRVTSGGWGPIRRALSDDSGTHRPASATISLDDNDGAIRAQIAEDEGRFYSETTAMLSVLSEAGRAANLDERPLLRGKIEKAESEITRNGLQRSRSVRLDVVEALAPYLDQTIPKHSFLRSDFPDIHRDVENTRIPLVAGEHSDAGTLDVNGNSAEKGLVPAIHVGTLLVIDGSPGGSPGEQPAYLEVPTNLEAIVNGTPGTSDLYYSVTALSEVGETLASETLQVETAPAVLSSTNSITLTFDAVVGATGYVIYGRRNTTPVRRLKVIGPEIGSPASPAFVTYTDTGVDVEYAPGPPTQNTAQVPSVSGGFFWDMYVIGLGYIPYTRIFASDVAKGTEPRRATEDAWMTGGVDFLTPSTPWWPLPDPWYTTASGLRVTVLLARGPRSFHHITGVVTIAVQTCGYEDVGDGTGDSIQQAFPMLQFMLNEHVLKNGGEGYKTGNWGPLETWNNGSPATPMLQTSKFQACQDLTKLWLGDAIGYLGAVYLREPITVREFLQWAYLSFNAFGASNHHGQFYPVLYDDLSGSPAVGRIYRERMEILRLEPPTLDKDHVEPNIGYQFDYDPDARKFRSEVLRAKDDDAIERQPQYADMAGPYALRFTRDAATAQDAMDRRCQRLKYPRWRQPLVAKFSPALEDELGDQFLVTHRDGRGEHGWEDHPFLLTEHVVDPNIGEVRLTGYDIAPLFGSP
jgi:hypothetical protein